ncbi:MAG: dihydrofolate reductase [Chitinophagales bacterium]
MIVSMIVAVAKNNVIGKDNKLLWKLSDDLRRFKRITSGHAVLMGRKTFESLGKPLPNRTNLVVTRDENFTAEGAHVFNQINEALEYARSEGEEELFIIGGGEIYQMMLPAANKLYLTKVHAQPEGDTFFPEIQDEEWDVINEEAHKADDRNEFDFVFLDLERR